MSDETKIPSADAFLAVDKFNVDEGHPHIKLVDDPDDIEFRKLVNLCPAALYRYGDDGSKQFDCAGCLECGTCRIACGDTIIKRWEFPRPTMGVEYRYG